MKCPLCHQNVHNLRKHALQHVRADEAYAIETFDHAKGVSQLTLHSIAKPLDRFRVEKLREQIENATTTIIHGTKLRRLEASQKIAK
jgi:hypothetical protein